MVELKYKCAKCGEPAHNATVFRDPKSSAELLDCPKCKSSEIIQVCVYSFVEGWEVIKMSGVKKDIEKLGNVYLQLVREPFKQAQSVLRLNDIPNEVRIKLIQSYHDAQKVLIDSGVLQTLEQMGFKVKITSYTSITI